MTNANSEADLSLSSPAPAPSASCAPLKGRVPSPSLAEVAATFQAERDATDLEMVRRWRAWTRSHLQSSHVEQVLAAAEMARRDFEALVTVGIGGSDLSARVYHDTLNHPYHNLLSREDRGGSPEVYFTGDTFDPLRLDALLEVLGRRGLLRRTLFNVISKSGTTGETISSLMVIRRALEQAGASNWRGQVLATTGLEGKSVLRDLHQESPFYSGMLLPVPEGVGGRFSGLSPVGLFFLAATASGGEDAPRRRVQELLSGVAAAHDSFNGLGPDDPGNLAYRLAWWLHEAETKHGVGTLVFYNYADNDSLAAWMLQLYEESIQERGAGLNVIPAKGPTSNHSILNGIIRGPRDKVVLVLQWRDLGSETSIPTNTGIGGDLAAFEGLQLAQVQTASLEGTVADFKENGVPCAVLSLPRRDARTLGYLMRLLMDTVAVKGRLQNLHLDADTLQPAYEKELTYLQAGVEGYKTKTRARAQEMQKQLAPRIELA